ncbi:hypothetical protein DU504_12880 [Haloplanus salinus]|jgi:hypothetical protein|uniref:Uncharacterized protein n=1 Tax=Haloplanus salinus TaxID=1126245 RepID=A0A368ND22_9EURY|nr:hypothetical protein [Haloplanus salinus]RCU48116.1 hypothetical protein DU504_12880 [Haloplanus salinus]
MPAPSPLDHVVPTDADYPDGVYRVVGTGDGTVTLLRVTDAAGRRAHTGELVSVDADTLDEFTTVDPPTTDRSLGTVVASSLATGYWSVRAFGGELRAHPRPTVVAVATALVGAVGDATTSLPGILAGGLLFAGCLALAYVGGGRLSTR